MSYDPATYEVTVWSGALAAALRGLADEYAAAGGAEAVEVVAEAAEAVALLIPGDKRGEFLVAASREVEPTPEDDDGFVSEGASGACYASLNGRPVSSSPTVEGAFVLLAAAMVADGYHPNAWHVNERGNTTLVALNLETGAYEFTETAYV